jgi:hypothetical protein
MSMRFLKVLVERACAGPPVARSRCSQVVIKMSECRCDQKPALELFFEHILARFHLKRRLFEMLKAMTNF